MEALASYEAAVRDGKIPEVSRARGAFDLKGVMSSLTVLRLKTRDLGHIEKQLRLKVTQFPQFFQDAPVVIDMGGLDGSSEGLPLSAVAHLLRACKVVPVAVINLADAHKAEALAAGLGVLAGLTAGPARPGKGSQIEAGSAGEEEAEDRDGSVGSSHGPAEPKPGDGSPGSEELSKDVQAKNDGKNDGKTDGKNDRKTEGKPDLKNSHRPPIVVRTPVRSGQIIYAQGTDLIVLAPVNPGAQLVADGHIHVYAPLRGRALAGASGYSEARIFCHRLEAELLSVAGAYVMADDIPEERWGKAVQVYVENGECRITPL